MTEDNTSDYVVPVVSEELHADVIPVETGSVRVVKRVEGHDEILRQELRKGRVEVRRVRTDRVVDGPQQSYREGDTLIVPVVSEILRVQKQWVVTEEIHITQIEEREVVEQKVAVNREVVEVERFDGAGNVISSAADSVGDETARLERPNTRVGGSGGENAPPSQQAPARKVLTRTDSLLKR
jgi:stress response protein YsnF